MLNKKELALINSKIELYRKWAKEEEAEARRASIVEDRRYPVRGCIYRLLPAPCLRVISYENPEHHAGRQGCPAGAVQSAGSKS